MTQPTTMLGHLAGSAEEKLAYVVDTMREMSRQTDPQQMSKDYGARIRRVLQTDRMVSLSRRDLAAPAVRVTRTSLDEDGPNPWTETDRLPVFTNGVLSDLIWGDVPTVDNNFRIDPADPGFGLLGDMKSILAIPLYDQGKSLNMVVLGRSILNGFNPQLMPEHVWMSNLFGRATHTLVLSQQVKKAYDTLDRELQKVGEIQQSLLPTELPKIPTLDLAVHYRTSKRAGGDYYDFFPLRDGRWGILMADVSGHGTPAAVIMAVTHSIAHTCHGDPDPPGRLLSFVNHHLAQRYTGTNGSFVTAFYGIYNPTNRQLCYATAGHCPPRLRRGDTGHIELLDQSRQLPLGIEAHEAFTECQTTLRPGDSLLIFTDGIPEARGPGGHFFGEDRLDRVLASSCSQSAAALLACALDSLTHFADGIPPADDCTLLAVKVA